MSAWNWRGGFAAAAFVAWPLALQSVWGVTINEGFSGTNLNANYWVFENTVVTARVDNGLMIDIPANPGTGYRGGIRSTFPLVGDFDVQVNFNLGDWVNLQNYGLAAGLMHAAPADMRIYRVSTYEYYLGVIPKDWYGAQASGEQHFTDTTTLQGRLRFSRHTGSGDDWGLFSAYYWDANAGNWQPLMSRNHQAGDDTFFLGVWSVGGGNNPAPLQITFSNLVVTWQTPPTNIVLSNTSILEQQASGTQVGVFSTMDADASNTFAYALVAGAGSEDNGLFTISDSNLLSAVVFDYATKSNCSIRVQSTDQSGLSTQNVFTISILKYEDPTPVLSGLYPAPDGRWTLEWTSISSREYTVFYTTNLQGDFVLLQSNLLAYPPLNTYTDTVVDFPQKYWRVTTP